MDEGGIMTIIKGFFLQCYNFMNIQLTWGPYTFTLWKAMTTSLALGIVGYLVGSFININKDN